MNHMSGCDISALGGNRRAAAPIGRMPIVEHAAGAVP